MAKADVIIAGGGAAGLLCAIEAGRRGRSVVVLERNAVCGEKIRISGGGRCNFTNLHTRPDHFISANPAFARSALARYTPSDFMSLVERHDVAWHEKKDGQLFCDRSSLDILAMLRAECTAANVRIVTGCRIEAVNPGFAVTTSHGVFETPTFVAATGGLLVPKLGATDFGHRLARQFRLKVVEPRPALVGLVLDEPRGLHALHGVSFEAEVRVERASFRDKVLVTHHGLSGPAILQVSSYWRPGEALTIEPAGHVPRRLAPLLPESSWTVTPSRTEGFGKAEVTAGGVDTRELSSQTMEARRVPGLYFIGEVVDVTGQLGGFNFQWAWASGAAAGRSV